MTNETRSAVALTPSEMLSTDVEVLFQDPSGIRRGAALDWVKAAPLFDATWIKKTWAELSAITTASDGQGAMVIDGDAGTHTDPVVAGTVDNAGMYVYRATGTVGWERIADTLTKTVGDAAAAAIEIADETPSTASGTANAIVLTPKTGFSSGSPYIYKFNATAKNTGAVIIDVSDLTAGDYRQLRLPDGATQIPPGLLRAGQEILIQYSTTTGLFTLIYPQAAFLNDIPLTQINSSESFFQCALPDGVATFSGGSQASYALPAPADRQGGEYDGVILEIAGLNDGDPRQVRYYPGDATNDQIGEFAWVSGDILVFGPITPGGWFPLLYPPRPELTAAASNAQTIFYTSANAQTYALSTFGK